MHTRITVKLADTRTSTASTTKVTVTFVMKNMNVKHLDDTEMKRQVELLTNLQEIAKKLEPVTCPHCGQKVRPFQFFK